jgi:hypothetical protein
MSICRQLKIGNTLNFFATARMLLFILSISGSVSAQNVKVNGGFVSDSLKIGEQTAYYLAAHYPSELTLVFPDSTYGFGSFEFQKRSYFPTQTTNGISVDSAVYYLTTFEIDSVQFLDLPVFVVLPQDCTVFESARESVLISQLVAQVPDSVTIDKLPLKMNTAYENVNSEFNYWLALIAAGILLILATAVWLIFGKKIRIWLMTRRLKKKHFQFLESYNSAVHQLQRSFSSIITETALSSWKKYMEQLEARPYTKLTTKETLNVIKDEQLARTLHTVDAAIYGHNTAVIESLEKLKRFADQRFSKKLEEVRHGQ